jgi:hypothetical protein
MSKPANPHIPPDEAWIEHRDAHGERDGVIVVPLMAWRAKRQGLHNGTNASLEAWQAIYPDATFRSLHDPAVAAHYADIDADLAAFVDSVDSREAV